MPKGTQTSPSKKVKSKEIRFNIRRSAEVRKLLISIIKENNLSIQMLADTLGLEYKIIVMWFNALGGGWGYSDLPEEKIYNLCALLGVEVKWSIIKHPIPTKTIENCRNNRIFDSLKKSKSKYRLEMEEYFNDGEETSNRIQEGTD